MKAALPLVQLNILDAISLECTVHVGLYAKFFINTIGPLVIVALLQLYVRKPWKYEHRVHPERVAAPATEDAAQANLLRERKIC